MRQLLAVRVEVTFDLSTFSKVVFPKMITWLIKIHQKIFKLTSRRE